MLKQSQKIPDFNFVNRKQEISAITGFCNSNDPSAVVLLILAESGIGKSRLMKHVSSLLKDESWSVIHINSQSKINPYSDVIAGLSNQLLKVVSTESRMDILTLAKHRLMRLLRASPQIASAGLKQIPVAGDMLAEGLDQIGDSILNSSESIVRQRAILNLAELTIEISHEVELLLFIDDVHKLTAGELDDLAIFLGGVSISPTKNIRIIVGAQPQSTSNPNFENWRESVNRSGLLLTLDLEYLSNDCIRNIIRDTVKNHQNAEPLLTLASGNPQLLLDHLLELNAKGLLEKEGKYLVLPKNIYSDEFGKSLWKSIGGDSSRRRLIGVLAISSEEVSISNLIAFSNRIGITDINKFNALISQLENEKVLKWNLDSKQNIYVLSFLHEITKTQIRQAILSGPISTRIEYGTIAMSDLLEKLQRIYKDPVSLVKSATTKSLEFPNFKDSDIELLKEYSDLLFTTLDPDYFAFTLGLIRIANHNGNNLITAYCGNSLSKYLINGSDAEQNIYEKYIKYIVEAEYKLGSYEKVLSFSDKKYLVNNSIAYYVAASYLVMKNNPESIYDCLSIVNNMLETSSESQPQYQLLNAIAHQEIGKSIEAQEIYESHLNSYSEDENQSLDWSVFLAASPLFLNTDVASKYCEKAVQIAHKSHDVRRQGIALNNDAFCKFVKGDLSKAIQMFNDSEVLLNANAPHEGIFPSNNSAAMDMISGNFQSATDKLNRALFRTSSENYATTLRINLAVANYMHLGVFDLEKFDSQIQKAFIKEHTFLQWLIEYNRCFLIIKTSSKNLKQSVLDDLYSRIAPVTETINSKLFWNNLMDQTKLISNTEVPKFEIIKSPLLRTGFNPDASLIRPALLLFGRV